MLRRSEGTRFSSRSDDEVGGWHARSARSELGERRNQHSVLTVSNGNNWHMRIFDSKRALRLLAPLAFVLVVGGTGLVAATASADKKLPTRTPEELLVDVQQAKIDG